MSSRARGFQALILGLGHYLSIFLLMSKSFFK
jgi:hypothetical protein